MTDKSNGTGVINPIICPVGFYCEETVEGSPARSFQKTSLETPVEDEKENLKKNFARPTCRTRCHEGSRYARER